MREILGLSGCNCNNYQMHIRISLMLYGPLAGQLVQQPLRQLLEQRAIGWNNARLQIRKRDYSASGVESRQLRKPRVMLGYLPL